VKKRDKGELLPEEINYIIDGMLKGDVKDYQISALCMAIFFNGMSMKETEALTLAMTNSGDKIDLSSINGFKADKHSTGGVGDTVSLVAGPIIAAAGIPFVKISGRGLGHTGGTIDKLEAISGFNTSLSVKSFINQINDIGIAITGQTANIAPADKILYALRDVTGTVKSLPLISSSIMSKKLAVGADGIVLDVKVGSGAFMQDYQSGVELAQMMVNIGKAAGIKISAIVSDMNQPLSDCVGNAIEVKRAIETLNGNKSSRLAKLSLEIAAKIFMMANIDSNYECAYKRAEKLLNSKAAFNKFKDMVKAQGGDVSFVDNPEKLNISPHTIDIKSSESGFVKKIDAMAIGKAAMMLGAGRFKKTDIIDLSVGLKLHVSVGEYIEKDTLIATLYVNNKTYLTECLNTVTQAFELSKSPVKPLELIYDIIN